jgi:hypothetical protein
LKAYSLVILSIFLNKKLYRYFLRKTRDRGGTGEGQGRDRRGTGEGQERDKRVTGEGREMDGRRTGE